MWWSCPQSGQTKTLGVLTMRPLFFAYAHTAREAIQKFSQLTHLQHAWEREQQDSATLERERLEVGLMKLVLKKNET